jgi:hypothetical protein
MIHDKGVAGKMKTADHQLIGGQFGVILYQPSQVLFHTEEWQANRKIHLNRILPLRSEIQNDNIVFAHVSTKIDKNLKDESPAGFFSVSRKQQDHGTFRLFFL